MKKITLSTILFMMSFLASAQQYFSTTTFGNTGSETNYDVAKDSQGNVYSVGLYSGTLTVGATTVTHNGGNADGYLTKHDANGNAIWVKSFGGALDDVAIAVTIDNADNILLTGYFQGAGVNSFDADPGPSVFNLSQVSPLVSRDCFIVKLDNNGNFIWAKQISNPSGGAANEDSKDIAVDSANNVYVVGGFHYADFDPGSAQELILASGSGNAQDGFLLKLDSNGNFNWVKTFYSTNNVVVESLDFNSNGDIYVAGRYQGVLDLNPSTTVTANSTTSNGSFDTFIVKLDATGNYIWGNVYGGSGFDVPQFIKTVGTDVYIGGTLIGSQDLDPSSGTNTYTVLGSSDAYISKFDSLGNYISSNMLGSSSTSAESEEVYRMTVGPNGNLFLTGVFLATADFDYSINTVNSTSNGGLDCFILELTPSLQYVDHLTIGGSGKETFAKMIFNADNSVLFSGSFNSSTVDFNPFSGIDNITNNGSNSYDVFMSRFTWQNIPLSTTNFNSNEIVVYPNPVKNYLILSDSSVFSSYKIYNSLGQMVKQSNEVTNTISFEGLNSGIYILQMIGTDAVLTKRIMKE